jgi:uncharacterized YccA/Bax inhibitor family protein
MEIHMSNHKALNMFGRSGNPALKATTFSSVSQRASSASGIQATASSTMTLQGTVNKTGILLALVVLISLIYLESFFPKW